MSTSADHDKCLSLHLAACSYGVAISLILIYIWQVSLVTKEDTLYTGYLLTKGNAAQKQIIPEDDLIKPISNARPDNKMETRKTLIGQLRSILTRFNTVQ